jgi:hypothetical protein
MADDDMRIGYNLTVAVNDAYNERSSRAQLLGSYGESSRLVAMLVPDANLDELKRAALGISHYSTKRGKSVDRGEKVDSVFIQGYIELINSLAFGTSDKDTDLLLAAGFFTENGDFEYRTTQGARVLHARKAGDTVTLSPQEDISFEGWIQGSYNVQEGDVLLLTTDEVFGIIGENGLSVMFNRFYETPDKIIPSMQTAVYQMSTQKIKREDVPLVVIKVGDIEYRADVTLEDVTSQSEDHLSGVPISDTVKEGYQPVGIVLDFQPARLNPDASLDTLDLDDTSESLASLRAVTVNPTGEQSLDDEDLLGDSKVDDQTTTDPHRYAVQVPDLVATDEHDAVVVNDLGTDTDDDIAVDASTWDLAGETHAHDPPGLRDSAFPTQLDKQYAVLERSFEKVAQERDGFHSRAEEAEDLLAEAQDSLRFLGDQYRELETNRNDWEGYGHRKETELEQLEGEFHSLEAQLADKDKELTNVQNTLARYKEERRLRINLFPKRKSRVGLFAGVGAALIGVALAASVVVNETYKPVLGHAEAFKYELQSRHVVNTHPKEASCDDARTQFESLEQGVSQEVRATKAFDRAENLKSRFLESIDCE